MKRDLNFSLKERIDEARNQQLYVPTLIIWDYFLMGTSNEIHFEDLRGLDLSYMF